MPQEVDCVTERGENDQVKERKDTARCGAKPWENFGLEDTDPYREDVGKLGGAVQTELSKPQETWKQAGSPNLSPFFNSMSS